MGFLCWCFLHPEEMWPVLAHWWHRDLWQYAGEAGYHGTSSSLYRACLLTSQHEGKKGMHALRWMYFCQPVFSFMIFCIVVVGAICMYKVVAWSLSISLVPLYSNILSTVWTFIVIFLMDFGVFWIGRCIL